MNHHKLAHDCWRMIQAVDFAEDASTHLIEMACDAAAQSQRTMLGIDPLLPDVAPPSVEPTPDVDDYAVAMAMGRGGSFVRCLADAWFHGDPRNRARLKAAFPDYWAKYQEITR